MFGDGNITSHLISQSISLNSSQYLVIISLLFHYYFMIEFLACINVEWIGLIKCKKDKFLNYECMFTSQKIV